MPPKLSNVSLLLLGLVLGILGGLYYAWLINPLVYTNITPAQLSQTAKTDYLLLTARTHQLEQNWPQTEQRLVLLSDPAITQTVSLLLEDAIRQNQLTEIDALAQLAQALGAEGQAVALFAPTPLGGVTPTVTPSTTPTASPIIEDVPNTPTATPTQTATPTPFPTFQPTEAPLPTATLRPNFRILIQERICEAGININRIEVISLDAFLEQEAGIEVRVEWDDGSDRFFTGFQPEAGIGYGDFTMQPDLSYTVYLAKGSDVISGLRMEPCDDGALGGWRLTFQNLILPTE